MKVNHGLVLFWLINFLCISLFFFPLGFNNAMLGILIAYCILSVAPNKIWNSLIENRIVQLSVILFVVQCIGLIYTDNLSAGLFMLEKKISFLLLPLFLVPALRSVEWEVARIYKQVGMIAFYGAWLLLTIALFRKFVLGYDKAFYFESFRDFEGFSPIHYVYFSIFFGCGSLFFVASIFDNFSKNKAGQILLVLIFLFCTFIIVLISSKTGIAAYVLGSILLLYNKLQNKKIFVISIVLILMSAVSILYFNQTTRERFLTGLSHDVTIITNENLPKDLEFTDLNMRLVFWKISLTHFFREQSIWIGVGTGDVQDYIDHLYNLPQYQITGYIGWNSHNQWVYSLIQLGVLGIIPIILIYFLSVRRSLIEKRIEPLIFLFITLIFSLTESIFEVNKGIVFFSLFVALAAASKESDTPTKSTA
jgi:O-antigen ligase